MVRPASELPLVERLYLRVDDKTKEKPDACTKALPPCSNVIRMGIEKVFDNLQT